MGVRIRTVLEVSMLAVLLWAAVEPGDVWTQGGEGGFPDGLPNRPGEMLLYEKRNDEAMSYYEEALASEPRDISAQYNLATLYFNAHRLDEALARVDAAIDLRREFPRAWLLKGQILVAERLTEASATQALDCFRRGLDMDAYGLPPSREMQVVAWSWSAALIKHQDDEKAQHAKVDECMNEALALSDGFAYPLLLLQKGTYQCWYRRLAEATQTLETALDQLERLEVEGVSFATQCSAAHNVKAIAYYKQERFREAFSEYQSALGALREGRTGLGDLFLQGVYSNAGILYTSAGQYESALALHDKADEVARRGARGEGLPNLWANPALALYLWGRKGEAFDQASGHDVPHAGIRFLLDGSMIYLTYWGPVELVATDFLSQPTDVGDAETLGERPIQLSSVLRGQEPVVTALDTLVTPAHPERLPPAQELIAAASAGTGQTGGPGAAGTPGGVPRGGGVAGAALIASIVALGLIVGALGALVREVRLAGLVRTATVEMRRPGFVAWVPEETVTLAIVFTDLVGFTAWNRLTGDRRASEARQAHFRRVRKLVDEHRGREIKTLGDGFLVAFWSVGSALDFALDLRDQPGHAEVKARAGVHIGPVQWEGEEEDVFGQTVNFAARVVGVMKGAEVWLSERAKQDVGLDKGSRDTDLVWVRHENVRLKGFPGRQTLWSVRPAAPAE